MSLSALSVALGVRPMRSVIFVRSVEGVPWQRLFRLALRCQTATWGGWGNIALPLPEEGCENDELLWGLLDSFDADTFHPLVPTAADLEWIAPERYEELHARRVQEFIDLPNGEAQATDELSREPLVQAELPKSVQDLLTARVAPLPGAPGAAISGPYTSHIVPRPLTPVERLKPLPTRVAVGPAYVDDDLALMAATAHGELSPHLRAALSTADVSVEELEPSGAEWLSAMHPRAGAPLRELAGLGLDRYAFRGAPAPGLVVCVGDEPWDFAFAHALSRLGVDAQWVPTRAVDEPPALHALSTFARLFQPTSALRVRLCSLTAEDRLDAFVAALGQDLINVESERCLPLDLIPVSPTRVFETGRDVHYQAAVVHEDGMTPSLPTPVPRKVAGDGADDIHWMTDIEVQGWKSIRHPALGEHLIADLPITDGVVRSTREALSYHCPNLWMLRPEQSVESQVPRPRLKALDLDHQVRALLEPHGWQTAPSDKGIYLRQSEAIFGGIEQLVAALSDDRAKLLTMFLNRKDAPGLRLERRQYVWLKDLIDAYPDKDTAESVILGLEDAGALIRGFVLKCQRCRRRRFYRLADIGEDFQCPRCWTRQPVNQRSLLVRPGIPEPTWRYGLSEVLFQFLLANGDFPLLSAVRFGSERPQPRAPFQLVGELDIAAPGRKPRELDIILAHGSELWLGEATVDDNLGTHEVERLERLAELAQLLSARGVVLITAQSWREETKTRAHGLFPGLWPELKILEGWQQAERWTPPRAGTSTQTLGGGAGAGGQIGA